MSIGYDNEEKDNFIGLTNDYSLLGTANALFAEDTLRKNYLFLRVALSEVLPRLSLELFTVVNMDDGSYLAGSEFKYRASDKVEVYLDIRNLRGSRDSEFGMMPVEYVTSTGIKMLLM